MHWPAVVADRATCTGRSRRPEGLHSRAGCA